VARTEAAIVAALDVRLTVMRLDVLGQLAMQGSRYSLPVAEAEPG
jgi:hypothetical protein